jgi:hypothetical protein
MAAPIRDSPRSSRPAAAPTRCPLRQKWSTGAATSAAGPAAVLVLVLVALAAGRTDACDTGVINLYNVSISVWSYNGWDITCGVPGGGGTLSPYGGST